MSDASLHLTDGKPVAVRVDIHQPSAISMHLVSRDQIETFQSAGGEESTALAFLCATGSVSLSLALAVATSALNPVAMAVCTATGIALACVCIWFVFVWRRAIKRRKTAFSALVQGTGEAHTIYATLAKTSGRRC